MTCSSSMTQKFSKQDKSMTKIIMKLLINKKIRQMCVRNIYCAKFEVLSFNILNLP